MQLIRSWRRQYPQDGFAAHVIGYVGEIGESELDNPEFVELPSGRDHRQGRIEREYNEMLRGVDGQRRVVVDNLGRERQMTATKEAHPGKNLQPRSISTCRPSPNWPWRGKRGAVVAMDPRTGEILAMVSRPAFDPNKFAGRISRKDWSQMANDPGHPLLNRAIQAQLAPGSTFKPIMAMAGLETGAIDDNFHVPLRRRRHVLRPLFQMPLAKHGTVDSLHRAASRNPATSSSTTSATGWASTASPHYADMAGLGHKTGVDLAARRRKAPSRPLSGNCETSAAKMVCRRNHLGSHRQGAITVTPIQMAALLGGSRVGGKWSKPHLIKDESTVPPRQAALSIARICRR